MCEGSKPVFASATSIAGAYQATGPYNGTAAVHEAPIGHIHSEMQEHDRLLHALNDEIAVLAERVNPVLRASMPTPSGPVGAPPAPIKSGLACSLSECNDRLLNSISRVRDLAARADL